MIYKNVDINMNAKEIEFLKSVQTTELNIMDIIHDICIKNNIEYGLMWGSLIGAIRHQGFIPWDDDIDIALSTASFLKLKKHIKKNSKLFLADYETKKWNRSVNRIYFKQDLLDNNNKWATPFIDVFVFNKAPIKKRVINRRLFNMNIIWYSATPILQKYLWWFPGTRKIISKLVYHYIYKSDMKITNEDYKNIYFLSNSKFTVRESIRTYNKDWFNKGTKLITFENRQYCIFKNSKDILKQKFDNYLELPSFETRRSDYFVVKKGSK